MQVIPLGAHLKLQKPQPFSTWTQTHHVAFLTPKQVSILSPFHGPATLTHWLNLNYDAFLVASLIEHMNSLRRKVYPFKRLFKLGTHQYLPCLQWPETSWMSFFHLIPPIQSNILLTLWDPDKELKAFYE